MRQSPLLSTQRETTAHSTRSGTAYRPNQFSYQPCFTTFHWTNPYSKDSESIASNNRATEGSLSYRPAIDMSTGTSLYIQCLRRGAIEPRMCFSQTKPCLHAWCFQWIHKINLLIHKIKHFSYFPTASPDEYVLTRHRMLCGSTVGFRNRDRIHSMYMLRLFINTKLSFLWP